MRTSLLCALMAGVSGCSWFSPCARRDTDTTRLSHAETSLAGFSRTITAYYGRRGEAVPASFDEATFLAVLAEAHPDKAEVQRIREGYRIRARPVDGGYYAVLLCDRGDGRKLMEDLSCTMSAVDVRAWDRPQAAPCEFEAEPATSCK